MRMTSSLPDQLASRFLTLGPNRERSVTIARLLEQELAPREFALEQVCLTANADPMLANEIEAWQGFDDNSEESQMPCPRSVGKSGGYIWSRCKKRRFAKRNHIWC